jgi:predicted ATPase
MITRIEIDGFKSLREFAVDLEPLTVFIGPNSAGKSNILDALALLARLSSMPIDDAFKQGRGRAIDQFTRRGGVAETTIRFAVEVFVPGPEDEPADLEALPNRYRYELTIERTALSSGAERLSVSHERLSTIERAADGWIAAHPGFAGRARHHELARAVFKQTAVDATERRLDMKRISREEDESTYDVPLAYTALASNRAHLGKLGFDTTLPRDLYDKIEKIRDELQLASIEAAVGLLLTEAIEKRKSLNAEPSKVAYRDELVLVDDALSAYRLVHLDSARLREPSERIGSDTLAPDASNLPTVLANLAGPTLGEIRADLVSLVPGVSSFEIVPDGDSFRIDFELSGGERLPARLVSDGTLRILALLTALRVQPRSAMIGVEEPENGVYPGRLRKLVEYMQEIAEQGSEDGASPTQLVLTTHSPVVLAALRTRPEVLRFVDLVRRDGQLATRARTVSATPGPDRGQLSISLREIDELLHAADSELGQ